MRLELGQATRATLGQSAMRRLGCIRSYLQYVFQDRRQCLLREGVGLDLGRMADEAPVRTALALPERLHGQMRAGNQQQQRQHKYNLIMGSEWQ